MTLENLGELPLLVPTIIWHRAANGDLTEVLIRMPGNFQSRQLLILTRIIETGASLEIDHPYYTAWMNDEHAFIVTRNGNAARIYQDGELIKADDGGDRLIALLKEGASTSPPTLESIERMARILHAEITGETPCEVCGCTDSWGCDEGCAWAEPGLCTACHERL